MMMCAALIAVWRLREMGVPVPIQWSVSPTLRMVVASARGTVTVSDIEGYLRYVFAKGAGIGDFELLAPAIYAIAALTTVTAIQRVWHVRNELSSEASGPPDV